MFTLIQYFGTTTNVDLDDIPHLTTQSDSPHPPLGHQNIVNVKFLLWYLKEQVFVNMYQLITEIG